MSNPRGIRETGRDMYTVDFSEYLPEPLKRDPKMKAFAAAVTEQMLTVSGNIDNVLIYSRIDELPEEMIDILAYDMHVDWYDYSYPLDVKRKLLKSSVKVHKKMGTKYATETAIRAIYPDSKIKEWFEYGGKHHCFRVILNAGDRNVKIDMDDMVKKINLYKRLSAHLDSINIEKSKRTCIFVAPSKEIFVQSCIKINPYQKSVVKKLNIYTTRNNLRYIRMHFHVMADIK